MIEHFCVILGLKNLQQNVFKH